MASRREKPARASVKLGVPGLDALIGAAMGPGSSIALSGPAQSGKTWLAVQFLLAGSTERQALLYVKVSPRKEAHEVLPFAEQLRELEQSGRATIKGERLNRPLAPWLGAWLESAGSDARIVVEVAANLDELSPREASWLSDAQRELAARGVTALFSVRAPGAEPRVIGLLSKLFGDATATLALELRSSEWGLERQLLVAGVRGLSVPSRYHALELTEDGLRLAPDAAVPAQPATADEAETPLYIGAPPYLQGAEKRLYVQRLRRHLEAAGGPGVKPVHGRPFFSQLLGELYAPRTDFGAVLVSEPGVVRHLAEKGLLMALENVFPEHSSLFIDKALKQATFFGHLFAVPQHVSVRVLYYRADLLRKHGLSPPRTWDEVDLVFNASDCWQSLRILIWKHIRVFLQNICQITRNFRCNVRRGSH